MAGSPKDELLLAQLQAGRNSAYQQLYRDYFGMVRYFVVRNSGTEEQAHDIFQDGVIALYEKVQKPGFELTAAVKTYLYSICRNLWLKRLRDTRPTADIADFEQYIAVDEPDDRERETELQLKVANACMEQLGEPCQKLLKLFYFDRKSMDEIAAEMGYTNAGNAKNQKYKCLQRLKKLAQAQLKGIEDA